MIARDLAALYRAQAEVARWRAERENASARVALAETEEARAFLLSQHEPVASLGIDREVLRALLDFTRHNDARRLTREVSALTPPA